MCCMYAHLISSHLIYINALNQIHNQCTDNEKEACFVSLLYIFSPISSTSVLWGPHFSSSSFSCLHLPINQNPLIPHQPFSSLIISIVVGSCLHCFVFHIIVILSFCSVLKHPRFVSQISDSCTPDLILKFKVFIVIYLVGGEKVVFFVFVVVVVVFIFGI